MASSKRSSFFRTVLQLGSAAAVALTARASLADHYRVPSGSMEPTVHVGDRIVVSKMAYGIRLPLTESYLIRYAAPARGDVVVIEPPDDESKHATDSDIIGSVLLKRVVAVAGDLVEVRDGHVHIDGREVPEARISLDAGGGPDLGPVRVPDGKVLLLGDNRGNSRDGRWFGFIDRERVLGRAVSVVARDGKLSLLPL
ncbi:MAG: Signal peptidase [Myxococcaceae bacterium]|nr:Signal peptidase [Myxococcaceae bacterium]